MVANSRGWLGDITIPAVILPKLQKRIEKPKRQPQPESSKGRGESGNRTVVSHHQALCGSGFGDSRSLAAFSSSLKAAIVRAL
jgi:hypothetical protein